MKNNLRQRIDIGIANALFVLHCLIGVFIFCGWYFYQIKGFYIVFLITWLFSWIFLGYCPVTKWEFLLRGKYNKNIDSNAEAIKYYMYKFFKRDIPSHLIFTGGLVVFIITLFLALFRG